MFREKNRNNTPIKIKTTEGIIIENVILFFEKIADKIIVIPANETKTGQSDTMLYSLKHVSTMTKNSPPRVKNRPTQNRHIEVTLIQAKYKNRAPTKVITTSRSSGSITIF